MTAVNLESLPDLFFKDLSHTTAQILERCLKRICKETQIRQQCTKRFQA